MLNYAIDPHVLDPHVPPGTELDLHHDTALVSIVGFRFLDTRVRGCPVPGHRNFDEVNLRFYVKRRAGDDWRRGVVFIREIVPRAIIALVARRVYGENYVAAPMRHEIRRPDHDRPGRLAYDWKLGGRWHRLRAATDGAPVEPDPDGEATFITEHYWGYSDRRGRTLEYQVEHPRWRVWSTTEAAFDGDVATLYGEAFVDALSARPRSAFVAEGSPVIVRAGRPLDDA